MVARRERELVGRADELAALRAASERAGNGTPSVVVVEGEPGIGKSRLVAELVAELISSGAMVATGHAVDLAGGALPYGVVAGLVRDLRDSIGVDPMVGLLGPRAAALGSLDPTLAPAGADLADRRLIFEAVQHLVLDLARDRLVCLVLEDLHWSDPSSLDLITFLATTVASGRLLLVATTRPEGGSRLSRLVALGELLSLGPLTDGAMRRLAANLTDPPEGAVLEQVISVAEGIPLYIEELIAVQAAAPSRVPGALALAFNSRLVGLDRAARHVLEAVAVAEGDVPADILRRVVRAKRTAVSQAIDDLVSRGLLDVVGLDRVRFHHELLRRSVADTLSPLIRTEWHRRWALVLQGLDEQERTDPAVLAALAHQWFHAGDPGEAVPAAVAAAQASSAMGAAIEAAVHWHRALLHWHRAGNAEATTGIAHEAALIEGTTVLRLAGAYAELQEVLTAEQTHAANDGVLRLWLDLGLPHISGLLGHPRPQAVPRQNLEAVLDRLSAEPRRPLVRATLFWLWWDAYDADQQVVARIIDLLDQQADPSLLPSDAVGIGLRRARFSLTYGDAEGALQIVRDVLANDEALHPVNQPVVESLHVWLLFVLGRIHECLELGERILTRLGHPAIAGQQWAAVAENLAVAHVLAGNLDRAEELMRTLLGQGDSLRSTLTGADLAGVLTARGRVQEAKELLATLLEHQLPGPGDAGFRFGVASQVVAARARVAALSGDLATARQLLEPVLSDSHLATDSEYLWSVVLDAGRLFDEPPTLEPINERARWAGVVQDAAERVHKYGSLGVCWTADVAAHVDRALERDTAEQWAALVDSWGSMLAPLEAARASVRLAERLAVDGQRDRAVLEAARARATADRVGAEALVAEIRATARRHRLRLDGAALETDGTAGLTPRELEVLALLADGRTNDQIATSLYISPKTASVHVSRIITKLGVANRTEAAAYAHRHGFAAPPDHPR